MRHTYETAKENRGEGALRMVFQMSASHIQNVRSGKTKIVIIGLGQVGLLLALHFVKEGVSVLGVDIDDRKINLIKQGVYPSGARELVETFNLFNKSNNFEVTSDAVSAAKSGGIHVLCLPTPLGDDKMTDFSALTTASEKVGQGLSKGNLVVVESTIYPGITTKVVKPILEEQSGLKAGEDFGLAYCSERIDPGNVNHRLDNTPRIIGGINESSAIAASAIYSLIVKAPIIRVKDCQTAELVKLVENIYRDVNIAFANEVALLCEKIDIDVIEVLKAASTKWSFMPHIPGAGVGGMCIPINPYYLLQCAREAGADLPLVQQARKINEDMPHHMVELVGKALRRINTRVEQAKICVLGLAYKGDVDDYRGAPGEVIAKELKRMGADVTCYDPLVIPEGQDLKFKGSLEEAVRSVDCIVVATDHSAFKLLNLKSIAKLANNPLAIVDGRHVLVPKEVEDSGITYIGIGRAKGSKLNIWDFKTKLKEQKA